MVTPKSSNDVEKKVAVATFHHETKKKKALGVQNFYILTEYIFSSICDHHCNP